MTKQPIDFKEPILALKWLDTALDMEKKKLAKCPVARDMVPGYEVATAWAYVVSGYFLVEQALKLLLDLREKQPTRTHTLSSELFDHLPSADRALLREYYHDFRCAFDGASTFPFSTLDDYLANLDGAKNRKGQHVGSFDWRYYLIENRYGDAMPTVGIEFLHETAYGVNRIIEYAVHERFEPSRYTYSYRLRWPREKKYSHWLTVRRNSHDWDRPRLRLEILWGPDYRRWFDFIIFDEESTPRLGFGKMPEDHGLAVVDMRAEVDAFDVKEGYRSIGVTWPS